MNRGAFPHVPLERGNGITRRHQMHGPGSAAYIIKVQECDDHWSLKIFEKKALIIFISIERLFRHYAVSVCVRIVALLWTERLVSKIRYFD